MRWAFFVLLFASFASAQANLRINPSDHANRAAEYRQLVASYCRLDYDGARLTPEGWNRVKAMTSFRENPDFRRIIVINRYEMAPDATNAHGRAIFSITYDVIGEYDGLDDIRPLANRNEALLIPFSARVCGSDANRRSMPSSS